MGAVAVVPRSSVCLPSTPKPNRIHYCSQSPPSLVCVVSGCVVNPTTDAHPSAPSAFARRCPGGRSCHRHCVGRCRSGARHAMNYGKPEGAKGACPGKTKDPGGKMILSPDDHHHRHHRWHSTASSQSAEECLIGALKCNREPSAR